MALTPNFSAKRYTKRFGTVTGKGNRIEVTGLKETMRALKLLPERVQRKVMRSAVGKACTPVVKAARKLIPKGDGQNPDGTTRKHLKDTVTKKVKTYKNGNVTGIIGPRAKAAPHDRLVDEGTEPHEITLTKPLKLGDAVLPPGFVIKHPGAEPSHYMKRALEQAQGQAQDALEIAVGVGIEREAAKLAKS